MSDDAPPDQPNPPKKPRKTRTRFGVVDVQLYERMAAEYLQGRRSLRLLSEATGVSQATAMKAINTGWPERSWPPLRERAVIYDRQMAAATSAAARGVPPPAGGGGEQGRPSPSTVITEAARFIAVRKDNLDLSRALRVVAGQLVVRVQAAVEQATAGRHGRRAREVVETRRGKEVRRVVWEDVVLPPKLTDLASALRDLAGISSLAGEAESRWSRWAPPEGAEGRAGWESLSDEELQEAAEKGVLPDGVSMADMRRRT